jgi:hypothetical protein
MFDGKIAQKVTYILVPYINSMVHFTKSFGLTKQPTACNNSLALPNAAPRWRRHPP